MGNINTFLASPVLPWDSFPVLFNSVVLIFHLQWLSLEARLGLPCQAYRSSVVIASGVRQSCALRLRYMHGVGNAKAFQVKEQSLKRSGTLVVSRNWVKMPVLWTDKMILENKRQGHGQLCGGLVVSLHFGSGQGRVVKQYDMQAVSVRCTPWAFTLYSLYCAPWFLLKLIQQIFIEHVQFYILDGPPSHSRLFTCFMSLRHQGLERWPSM